MKKNEVEYVTRRDDTILWIYLTDGTKRSVNHKAPIPTFVPIHDFEFDD